MRPVLVLMVVSALGALLVGLVGCPGGALPAAGPPAPPAPPSGVAALPAAPAGAGEEAIPEASPGPDKLPWVTDRTQALKKAVDAQKPVVVDVTAEWCGYCKLLEKKAFPHSGVQKLKDQAIWLRLDADRNQAWVESVKIQGYPTVLVLTSHGKAVDRLEGYTSGANLARFLARAIEKARAAEGGSG